MFQYIPDNFPNPLRCFHGFFNINGRNSFVLNALSFPDRVHVIDTEGQHIAVVNCIHNGIRVQLISEGLGRRQQFHVFAFPGVGGKNRRTGKSEQMIVFKRFHNFGVHISELAAVALIKNNDTMFVKDRMSPVLGNKMIQLLYSGDDDFILAETAFFVLVLQLPLQDFCGCVAVGSPLFETVVLLHGLIVQIFSVYHKQHLVHVRKRRRQLRRFKRGQGFSASRCMPDKTAGINGTGFFVVGGNFDTIENPLRCCNLIRTHHHQNLFGGKHTIAGQHIQNRMFGKKGFGKVD